MTGTERRDRRWRKTRIASLLALLMIAATWKFRPPKRYEAARWLQDYTELKRLIGDLYANLDWTAEHGSPDLVTLDRDTTEALRRARSNEAAAQILRGFVRAFGDGHMALRGADTGPLDPPPSPDLLSSFTPAGKACASLNFSDAAGLDFPFRFDRTPGFRRLGGVGSFAAASLDFDGIRFGLLRIGSFDAKNYRGACLREWRTFRASLTGTCEAGCRRDFEFRVIARLLDEMESEIRELEAAGSRILIVDVTGNGGGTAWSEPAAQLLTPGRIRPFRSSLVKNSHTVEALESDRQDIAHFLATHRPTDAERAVLEETLCRLDDLISEAGVPCDTSFFWDGRARRAGCSRLTTRKLYDGGVFAGYDGPIFPVEVQRKLDQRGLFRRRQPVWFGPVVVLTDRHTASAAELFAGTLKYSAGAVLVGQETAGAGGGWSLGRRPWPLPASGMQLYLPDTVVYWPDGANAREGLRPDLRTGWRPQENPGLMARQLLEALRSVDLPPDAAGRRVRVAATAGREGPARTRP